MTITQLRAFVAVATTGSVRWATGPGSGIASSAGRSTCPSGAVRRAAAASPACRSNVLVLVAAADCSDPVPGGRRTVSVERVGSEVLLLRESGSGTRSTAEELLDELGISPTTLNLGSNGAIRGSVQVGLGITLISRDAVARELEDGSLEEWIYATLPRQRAWHVVARAGDELAPTARLFLSHLVRPPGSTDEDRFRLTEGATATIGG